MANVFRERESGADNTIGSTVCTLQPQRSSATSNKSKNILFIEAALPSFEYTIIFLIAQQHFPAPAG